MDKTQSSMQLPEKPYIKLHLTPQFDDAGEASSISAVLTCQSPLVRAGKPLFVFETFYGNVPSHLYDEDEIDATDDTGSLRIIIKKSENKENQQEWITERDTDGDVVVCLHVLPRKVDITTPLGWRGDLRRDQGGLLTSGRWFLPKLAVEPTTAVSSLEWDLSSAPEGTRAVWSFGESRDVIVKEGRADTLYNSVYMVGPVQSYPPLGVDTRTADGQETFAWFYWFGSLPENLSKLQDFNSEMFLKMSNFFEDPAGPENTYRTFVRKSLRGFGGGGFLGSYVLEYDEQTQYETDYSLVALFTHEMVHSWAIIDDEDDGYDNYWYEEGIAELYANFLPFRFGFRTPDYFKSILNSHLCSYYTSPRINMDIRLAQEEFFNDFYAELIPYNRGNAYLLKIDYLLRKAAKAQQTDEERKATGDIRVLDSIVVDLAKRRKRGERILAKDWLQYLYQWLPKDEVDSEFEGMLAGKRIDLSEVAMFGAKHRLIETPREKLEYGFDRKSTSTRVISGVIPGTRAAQAGLKDGDEIKLASYLTHCSENFDGKLKLIVERDGHELTIEYWPRTFDKAYCLQLMPIDG